METIYLIRGSIGKFIKSFDLVLTAILKILAYYMLFRYVSNIEGITGSGMLSSLPVHLILAIVSMMLPNRCGILLAILLGLYNMSQVTMLGAGIAAVFFLTLYIAASRLFPDHVYMLALVPLVLHFKMYLLLPLIAGMYLGVVALIPMILGAIMNVILKLIPEFLALQMPKNVDELPAILSDIFKYGFNQILHNEEIVFIAIICTGVIILVHLLRKMEINYGAYIALVAGTVLGFVCLFMGKLTFGITDSYLSIIGKGVLAMLIVALIEFMHAALDYQSTQKLSFEDEEYQYYVTVIPKISVSKPKREVKNITEEPVKPAKPVQQDKRQQEMPRRAAEAPVHRQETQNRIAEEPVRRTEMQNRPKESMTRPADAVKRMAENRMRQQEATTRVPSIPNNSQPTQSKEAAVKDENKENQEKVLESFFEEE